MCKQSYLSKQHTLSLPPKNDRFIMLFNTLVYVSGPPVLNCQPSCSACFCLCSVGRTHRKAGLKKVTKNPSVHLRRACNLQPYAMKSRHQASFFAINAPCQSDHCIWRIEGTLRSFIKSIKAPSIAPYEKNINANQGMAVCLESAIECLFCAAICIFRHGKCLF